MTDDLIFTVPPVLLFFIGGEAAPTQSTRLVEQRGQFAGETLGTAFHQFVVEIPGVWHEHRGGDAEPGATKLQATRGALAFLVAVLGDDQARDHRRRHERAEAANVGDGPAVRRTPCGSTVTSDSTVSIPSPTSRVDAAAGSPKRTAKPWIRPRDFLGLETGAFAASRESSQVR